MHELNVEVLTIIFDVATKTNSDKTSTQFIVFFEICEDDGKRGAG